MHLADRIAYGNQGLDGTNTQMVPFFFSHFSLSNDSGLQNDVTVVAGRDAALVGSLPEGHETNLRKITLKAPVCFIPTALRMVEQLQNSSRSASKTVLDCSSWENALGYFPPLDFSLSTKGKWATLELKQSPAEVWWNKHVCSFFPACYLWHKVKTADQKRSNHIIISAPPRLLTYKRWMIHFFTVLVVNVHHTFPGFSGHRRGE